MGYLCSSALASTMRPWRSLCAFSYCCLLPFSSALSPSTATSSRLSGFSRVPHARYGSSGSGRRSAAGGSSAAGRLMSSWATAATTTGLPTGKGRGLRRGGKLIDRGGGYLGVAAAAVPKSLMMIASTDNIGISNNSRAFSGGKRPKLKGRARWQAVGAATRRQIGRGGGEGRKSALGMGKGLNRKKAKKEKAVLQKASGKGAAPSAPSAAAANPQSAAAAAASLVVVQDISDKEGFLEAFDLFRKAKSPRKILQAFETAKRKEIEGLSDLAAAAVKQELKLSRADLATSVVESLGTDEWDAWLASDLEGAQAVVRCACAASEPSIAEGLIEKAGFSCGDVGELDSEADEAHRERDIVTAAVSVYPNLITAYSRKGKRDDVMRLMEAMANAKLPVKTAAANRLLQGFHKRRDLEAVFKVLDVMAAGGVDGDDETYEWLANAAVRGVEFVTGAVSMATLPKEPVLPEAAFIGRSNVGKSSLINMVCNRKALAFTSKRPGKTQQFNYFMMNNNTENAFYLVDMPGMGYAKVPEKQRNEWSALFRSYITRRSSLRVLFHLIDGRHGPVGQDHAIMKLMAELPDTARYVVVLTKADKSDNTVSRQVLDGVVSALREAGVSRTPVVLTSAASKLGRDGMWRYLRLAALDKVLREQSVANKEGKLDDGRESGRDGTAWTRAARSRERREEENDVLHGRALAPEAVAVPTSGNT